MTPDERPLPPSKLPTTLRDHFARFDKQLRARADWREDHPTWRIYRTQDGITSPKVVWRDIGNLLEAAPVGPEIIPLNTVYYIPCPDMPRAAALAALLQSTPIRALAHSLAERAQGGWRRYLAWVVALLPIPTPLLDWWLQHTPNPDLDLLSQQALDGDPAPLTRHIEDLMGLSLAHHAALLDHLSQHTPAEVTAPHQRCA
jgi:hypothetical protein